MRRCLNPLIRPSPLDFSEVQNNNVLKEQTIVNLLKEGAGSTGYVRGGDTIDGVATPNRAASHRDHGIPNIGGMYRPRWPP